MPSDSELLLSFARDGDQLAFAALVRSHIDLVYSAAARRVHGDPHAAMEITQEVFLAMARHAANLAQHPVLNAWLHASTRNAAINLQRRERRHERQKQAMKAMQESPDNSPDDWVDVRQLLDPALDELGELDRRIVILRFFENRSFVEIGRMLRLGDDATRMRVNRALEKLRTSLERRGIRSTAASLAGILSAHSVTAAPPGLATSVTATIAATAVVPAGSGASILASIAMTKLPVATIGVALIATIAAVVYYRNGISNPPREPPPPHAAGAPIWTSSSSSGEYLESVIRDHRASRTSSISSATMEAEEKIAALRDVLMRLPEQSIPELKLATNGDWHAAVDDNLETPDDYRRAMAKIRSLAETRFAKLLQPAVYAYLQAKQGQFPRDTSELRAFASAPIEDAMLQRYRIALASEVPNVGMGGDLIITQNALIDSEYDNHLVIGPRGFGSCSSHQSSASKETAALMPAIRAYRAAHGGAHDHISQLMPYATTPEQRAIIERKAR